MTTTPLPAQENLREELYNADTHRPGGQVITVLREDLRALLTPAPLSPDVAVVVEDGIQRILEWAEEMGCRCCQRKDSDVCETCSEHCHPEGYPRSPTTNKWTPPAEWDLESLLRAVRAPRLTGEQAKAAFFEGYELGNDDGRNIDVFCHIKTHKPVNDANFAWQHLSLTRAAFAGELGEVDG